MQRTLNYTKRKRIEQKQALFSFTDPEAVTPEFNVKFDIDPSAYPESAALYVEAYRKETRQRFTFGSVDKIVPPQDRTLDEIDLSGSILFRVIVVDETTKQGLLLASGEGFRADAGEDPSNKSSLMAVHARDLGQVPWRVDFDTGGSPELCINKKIPNAIGKMRTDFVFQSLVLPAALKQILSFYMWNEDFESDISARWLVFAEQFADRPDSSDPHSLLSWIDEVVEGFTENFQFCDRLITFLDDTYA